MPDDILPVNCPYCGIGLALHLDAQQHDDPNDDRELIYQDLVCPACLEVEPIDLPVTILRIAKRA